MPEIDNHLIEMGFSVNRTGGHMARSMMLYEITALSKTLPIDAVLTDFKKIIVEDNILGKPTFSTGSSSPSWIGLCRSGTFTGMC
jgi:hypothetical protein